MRKPNKLWNKIVCYFKGHEITRSWAHIHIPTPRPKTRKTVDKVITVLLTECLRCGYRTFLINPPPLHHNCRCGLMDVKEHKQ